MLREHGTYLLQRLYTADCPKGAPAGDAAMLSRLYIVLQGWSLGLWIKRSAVKLFVLAWVELLGLTSYHYAVFILSVIIIGPN